ncbi:MAG: hypothetical protein D6766_06610 [Verrucomicrobia bacterium]|nr:MAG: hypothetical protein D6766_06610 [Verrucomicrobiota bacterium]
MTRRVSARFWVASGPEGLLQGGAFTGTRLMEGSNRANEGTPGGRLPPAWLWGGGMTLAAGLTVAVALWVAGCQRGSGRVTPLAAEDAAGARVTRWEPKPLPVPAAAEPEVAASGSGVAGEKTSAKPARAEASSRQRGAARATGSGTAEPRELEVAADWLNVRMAPGLDATRTGRLPQGTRVEVLGEQELSDGRRWVRVAYGGAKGVRRIGWVAGEHLAPPTGPEVSGGGVDEAGDSGERPDFGPFADLHYDPLPKRNYRRNPRIDARGLYVTRRTAQSERMAELVRLARETDVNALVIDFKDDEGWLLTRSEAARRHNPEANRRAAFEDLRPWLQRLRDEGLYLIARIVTFKDPVFARRHPERTILDRRTGRTFRSRDGLRWASPHDPLFRRYNLELAEEAAALGFNEVQFDYVRFPDVPKSADLDYRNPKGESKAAAIQSFLLEARKRLEPRQVYVAADVFGLVCTTVDDMRIGQYWEAISNAADYICPMMYPSHYGPMNYGLPVPDRKPYEVLAAGIRDCLRRNGRIATPAEVRPWIQGFTATWVKGHIDYGPAQIQAQMRALADHGIKSWLLWNPANRYEAAALKNCPGVAD